MNMRVEQSRSGNTDEAGAGAEFEDTRFPNVNVVGRNT